MNDSATHVSERRLEEAATEHTRSRYDTAASVYDWMEWPIERWLCRSWRKDLWAGIEGPEVLEIGVGTGKNVPYYPDDVHVTGIDLSPEMLKRARRMARRHPEKNVTLREMDAQALDLPDDTFDDVVATFVLCSVPNPVQGLGEALRVTRPGGNLHVLEHMRSRTPRIARVIDALDGPVHWLTGVHVARETVENVRAAGGACFRVCVDTKKETIRGAVTGEAAEEACIFTDENRWYLWLENKEQSRTRKAIDHSRGWAEDRDEDGIREVHVNTIEGIWTSLRNRLRRFRGVHKDHLSGYVAMFELAFNHDQITPALLQRMCGT